MNLNVNEIANQIRANAESIAVAIIGGSGLVPMNTVLNAQSVNAVSQGQPANLSGTVLVVRDQNGVYHGLQGNPQLGIDELQDFFSENQAEGNAPQDTITVNGVTYVRQQ